MKKVKHWRRNVLIIYNNDELARVYRAAFLQTLKLLATIYKLDYAVSVSHPIPALADIAQKKFHKSIVDLVYFRSNAMSLVDAGQFRSIIDCMFGKIFSQLMQGVEVWPQVCKVLKDFPFPDEFFRPLNYPYVEWHKDGRTTLCIYSESLLEELENE